MGYEDELKTFEDLKCWQACRELRRFCYDVCKNMPKEETFRLKDQIMRAGRSTTANIAEGYGRFHYKENIQFCRNARGSVYEVLDHFIAANDENMATGEILKECRGKVRESVALLNGYIKYLKTQLNKEK